MASPALTRPPLTRILAPTGRTDKTRSFSTVRFGDITAKTETARLVTGQMIADLIILGLAIKIIVGVVKRGQQRQTTPEQHPDPARPTTSRADETR